MTEKEVPRNDGGVPRNDAGWCPGTVGVMPRGTAAARPWRILSVSGAPAVPAHSPGCPPGSRRLECTADGGTLSAKGPGPAPERRAGAMTLYSAARTLTRRLIL